MNNSKINFIVESNTSTKAQNEMNYILDSIHETPISQLKLFPFMFTEHLIRFFFKVQDYHTAVIQEKLCLKAKVFTMLSHNRK